MANKGSCKADSCEKDVVGKGYCRHHYSLWRHGKMPKARYRTCRAEGCKKREFRASRCEEHQKVKPVVAAPAAAESAAPAAEAPAAES